MEDREVAEWLLSRMPSARLKTVASKLIKPDGKLGDPAARRMNPQYRKLIVAQLLSPELLSSTLQMVKQSFSTMRKKQVAEIQSKSVNGRTKKDVYRLVGFYFGTSDLQQAASLIKPDKQQHKEVRTASKKFVIKDVVPKSTLTVKKDRVTSDSQLLQENQRLLTQSGQDAERITRLSQSAQKAESQLGQLRKEYKKLVDENQNLQAELTSQKAKLKNVLDEKSKYIKKIQGKYENLGNTNRNYSKTISKQNRNLQQLSSQLSKLTNSADDPKKQDKSATAHNMRTLLIGLPIHTDIIRLKKAYKNIEIIAPENFFNSNKHSISVYKHVQDIDKLITQPISSYDQVFIYTLQVPGGDIYAIRNLVGTNKVTEIKNEGAFKKQWM